MTIEQQVLQIIGPGSIMFVTIRKRLPLYMRADVKYVIHRLMYRGVIVRRIGFGYSVVRGMV